MDWRQSGVGNWSRAHLDAFPRLGWVQDPTPVTALPRLAARLRLGWLGIKRDDLAEGLCGSTKIRKLDFILASEPWAGASHWASIGAIGSGHLASLSMAAARLQRQLEAYCFWEPVCDAVIDNLATLASGPSKIHYTRTRLGLAFGNPRLLLCRQVGRSQVIPPGASCPTGVIGTVRAGLELAEQVRDGQLPRPDRIYVPWGTGATATGLALGLSMAGMPTPVLAVVTVERALAHHFQVHYLSRPTIRLLERAFGPLSLASKRLDVRLVRGFAGRGYGHPTAAATACCHTLASEGIGLDPIYGGKAFSALQAREARGGGGRVLYWLTSHGGNLPVERDWREQLPAALSRDLGRDHSRHRLTRRAVLAGAVAAAGLALVRTSGYSSLLPGWTGSVLAQWQALVVIAAAEAIIPNEPGPLPPGPSRIELADNVDRYLRGMSARLLVELHAMFVLLEQGTGLGGRLQRFTRLEPVARRQWLGRLTDLGGLPAQASRGIRDLCMLAWYQDPRAWPNLGYGIAATERGSVTSHYDVLVAPAGQLPRGSVA